MPASSTFLPPSARSVASPPGPLILVVEDEPAIADIVVAYLHREGLRSHRAVDGVSALSYFERLQPDLVLLDIKIPGMDGLDVLRNIRAHSDAPVIMLTAFVDDVDRLLGLRLGADDYVTKPFNPSEVVARVRAVLRRSMRMEPGPGAAVEPMRIGPIRIDPNAHTVTMFDRNGLSKPIPVTVTEFRLLACLAARPGHCFSREHLIEHCLPESDALERVIDSHLSKLRRKLDDAGQPGLIETVRGVGYRLWHAS